MSVSRQIRISSEDKQEGETHGNFTVSLNNASYAQAVRGIIIKSISFANVFPNIFSDGGNPLISTTQANNVFTFQINGSPTLIHATIPVGFYNATQLASALQTAINAVSAPVSVVVTLSTSVNPKFLFTISGGTMNLLPRDINGILTNRIANQVGISVASGFVSGAYEVAWLPALQGLKQVYVCSDELAESHTIASSRGGESIPVLTEVQINTPFNTEVLFYSDNPDVDSVIYSTHKQLTKIGIRLCTRSGRILDTNQNSFTMMLTLLT